VDRALNRRLAIEASAEYSLGRLDFTNAALAGIEATRASFIPALEHALSVSSIPSAVTSVTTITDHQRAKQLFATGALLINLRETGKTIPYVTVGGGVVLGGREAPSATLVGTYQLGDPFQIVGTNSVALNYAHDSHTVEGIVGGGVKHNITPRWGLRFDARAQLYRNTTVNVVDTASSLVLRSTGPLSFPLINSGLLPFSSTAPLNGVPISGATTFTGTGYQAFVSVATGLFWRF
jgi:hypothetical protein